METRIFRTNLKCQNCVSKVAAILDSDQQISEWSVRTDDDRKLLSITGERVEPGHVRLLIQKAGFEVFDEISGRAIEAPSSFQQAPPARETYFPLMLVFCI
jgi:copper chaperone